LGFTRRQIAEVIVSSDVSSETEKNRSRVFISLK
jgi:hypothetical protein